MCKFRKQVKADLQAIKEQITNFNNTTLKKAEELDKQSDLLQDIKLGVKKAIVVIDQTTGCYKLRIEYNVPAAEIVLDQEGNETQDLMVRAINLLGLIPISDQVLLGKKLQEAKERNKEIWKN